MEAKDKAYVINTKDLPSGVAPLHYESNSWCPVINDDIEVFITEIRPGGRADLDNHPDSDHVFYYISGFGYQICDGERFDFGPGDFLFVEVARVVNTK